MSLGVVKSPVLTPFELSFALVQHVVIVVVMLVVDCTVLVVVALIPGIGRRRRMASCRVIILFLCHMALRADLTPPLMILLIVVRHTARHVVVSSSNSVVLISTVRAILSTGPTEPKDQTEIKDPHPCSNHPQNRTG
jgi:hypothetical protein